MQDLQPFAHTTRGTYAAIVVMTSWLLGTTTARAEASAEDKLKAREAYARANAANERGDYVVAARELALADALAPNAVTLQAALEAALDADAPVLGMEMAVRAENRQPTAAITELATTARKRFLGRTGRVVVVCPETKACQATLDGEPIAVAKELFVTTGKHVTIVSVGEASVRREIDVKPQALVTVSGVEEKPQPAASPSSGLSPVWFGLGAAVTVAAGVGAAISGADTKEKHDTFVTMRCAEPGAAATCSTLASDGASAQARTNVLAGVAAAFGLTTVVLGVVTFSKKNSTTGPSSSLTIEPWKNGAFARLVVVLP